MAYLPLQEGPTISWIAGEALGAGARVKLHTDGTAMLAGVAELAFGYVDHRGAASGANATIFPVTTPSMVYAIAHAAVEVGDVLYSQAAGRVDDVDDTPSIAIGYCVDIATAQDQIVRVLRTESFKSATA